MNKIDQVDENERPSFVGVKEAYSVPSRVIDSQINQTPSESEPSLEELMAQMKSI